jgi:Tol biopolymer transport system component
VTSFFKPALAAALLAFCTLGAAAPAAAQSGVLPPPGGETPIPIVVHEGTSMAVSVSPDGRWLAVDLQGSLWIVPSTGGRAKRITDYYNDARQPQWSPDGKRLVYFAYRDGGYHLWTIEPDGRDAVELTSGSYDDREPIWSPDGRTIAFSSDRGGSYAIWTLDVATRVVRQATVDSMEDRMPSWSADGTRIAFVGARDDKTSLFAVAVADGQETKLGDVKAHADALSLGPAGQLATVVQDDTGSRLAIDGRVVSGTENVFPVRASWDRDGGFYYVSDGRIRRRVGERLTTVNFQAELEVVRPAYKRAKRDWDSTEPRKALGILHPAISPDGAHIVFAALGDLYLVSSAGGVPENLTHDAALDVDPAWSPDGRRIVYSSDKGGGLLQLWIRDLDTGKDRRLTDLDTQPLGAAWSPDGSRIAFIDVDGRWGAAGVCIVDVATGKVTRLQPSLDQPGSPTWSPDGRYVAITLSKRFSNSFREGTNQVFVIPTDGTGKPFWQVPEANMSIDTRGGGGPTWSPDGGRMAAIYEGLLKIWPVAPDGAPMGPPRSYTSDIAYFPTWTEDSRTVLFQSADTLKTINLETGAITTVPIDLTYRLAKPVGRTIIHVGKLVDAVHDETQSDKDIVIDGNRIAAIRNHDPKLYGLGDRVVEAPGLTAIPGLIEHHAHVQKDFGANVDRAWLAYGVTTVRDPGNQIYDGLEDREASEAGVRPSPRIYTTGPLYEWRRVYYKMGLAVSSLAHLERELERARLLRYDLLKSYVRMPDLAQRRMVEAAHAMGVPVTTHEIFPAAFSGVDDTEHMGASSRRGYSPKQGPLGATYEDVLQIAAKSGRVITPTNLSVLDGYLRRNPAYRDDPRLSLYPTWARNSVLVGDPEEIGFSYMLQGTLRSVKAMHDAGVTIAAGTDTMIAINLDSEISSYVDAGMTPFQALQAATINSARDLNLDAGALEAGKLADIVLLDGDPRENIANTFRVRTVIANGRVFDVGELLASPQSTKTVPPIE